MPPISDQIQGKKSANPTSPRSRLGSPGAVLSCPAPGGVGGGTCRRTRGRGELGCPQPPPRHITAFARAFCRRKAAGGFAHPRAPRLSTCPLWCPQQRPLRRVGDRGGHWRRRQMRTFHSPLQHPTHSCSGEAPGSVGQCCLDTHWFGWMWPSGTIWSAQHPSKDRAGAWCHHQLLPSARAGTAREEPLCNCFGTASSQRRAVPLLFYSSTSAPRPRKPSIKVGLRLHFNHFTLCLAELCT